MASGAAIDIRPLDTIAQVFTASGVLGEVWGGDDGGMPPNLLQALIHSGNYGFGLYEDDRMIGASVAFFAAPDRRSLHSHITGILPGHQGQGLGRRFKEHQRDWASAREVDTITWTFDPLVARNAHFNLTVLGARVDAYLVDHYGPMSDGVNRGDETDRLMVQWDVRMPEPALASAGDAVAAVGVPRDIEALRADAPVQSRMWRLDVRRRFLDLLGQGLVVGGFRTDLGYLFVRP